MKKISPTIWDDEEIYRLNKCEVEFLLNSRRLFDFGCGERFDQMVVEKMKLSVGLLLHISDVIEYDDSVTENFFNASRVRGVENFYAIPTGYCHDKRNEEAMEVLLYEPPLLGKISSEFKFFSKIRGGQIGIYSRSHYLFSACLNFAFLDVDGEYSLILGDRKFVENVAGINSWKILDERVDISGRVRKKLDAARYAYGYQDVRGDDA